MGQKVCGLCGSECNDPAEGEGSTTKGQANKPEMAPERKAELIKRHGKLEKMYDDLFAALSTSVNATGEAIKIIIAQKEMTIGNVSTLSGIVDNLEQTKGFLTVMQRGLFSFEGDTEPRTNLPHIPKFAGPEGDNQARLASKGGTDIENVVFYYCDGKPQYVRLRFSGSFVWVLTPDGERFSATLPYLAMQSFFITFEKRLRVTLIRAGKEHVVEMGCDKPGKKDSARFHKKDNKEEGSSIEHLVEKLQTACATMGTPLPLEYAEAFPATQKFKDIAAVIEMAQSGKPSKLSILGDYLVKQRAEINRLTDGEDGPDYTAIRTTIQDSRIEVQNAVMDGNDTVHDELSAHMELLDMEFDLQSDSLNLGTEDIALCNAFIQEYGSDQDRDEHCSG